MRSLKKEKELKEKETSKKNLKNGRDKSVTCVKRKLTACDSCV